MDGKHQGGNGKQCQGSCAKFHHNLLILLLYLRLPPAKAIIDNGADFFHYTFNKPGDKIKMIPAPLCGCLPVHHSAVAGWNIFQE
jgi:hypothetical protein